tara:strand:- start:48320 stop:49858 length:1539 start_codon:yes stop_codon:yes gene_type:complete
MKFAEIEIIKEEARIQHAEDVIFWEGSKGALRVLEAFKDLAEGDTASTTIKWDGSPAVIFGRDEKGQFIFTDKSGFVAKGYDGKSKSGDDIEKMLLSRGKGGDKPESYKAFASNMKNVFPIFEKSIPEDHRGYFKGDLLYFTTPPSKNGAFVFKPNLVTYTVQEDSDIGKKISVSKAGVVIHRIVEPDGSEKPLQDYDIFQGNSLLVLPPVTAQQSPQVDMSGVNKLSATIKANASAIDSLLDKNKLRDMKVSDFSNILYTYTNSKVDTGLNNLGRDFVRWLQSSVVSKPKQEKIINYINTNMKAFGALWQVVSGIMNVKDNIIKQLDQQSTDVKASIGDTPGGEGYVMSRQGGDLKFVNRAGFSAANRKIKREGANMKATEFIPEDPRMTGNQSQENKMAKIGRVIMDMGMKMNKDDEAIALGNKLSKLGDALTRFGTPGGPTSFGDLQKVSELDIKTIKQAMAVGQKMPDPAIGSVKDPEPSDDDADDDNEFNPSDADIDKMATSYAQGA